MSERRASDWRERQARESPRPVAVPEEMPARREILALQQTLGNHAVAELLGPVRSHGPQVARLLLDQNEWTQRTAGFKRKGHAKLQALDQLIQDYATARSFADKLQALDDLDDKAREWLDDHWLQNLFGAGLTSVLTQLRNEIGAAKARARMLANSGYEIGPWAMQVLDAVTARRLSGTALMDALFDAVAQRLAAGFTYDSAGSPTFLASADKANCQNLSNGLKVLAETLGLDNVGIAIVSERDFASAAGSKFVSEHNGNVRFTGEKGYSTKRFVFSMHVAATYGGTYYDLTTRSKYDSPSKAIAWKLKEDGNDRRQIEAVNDGATFPDGTPVNEKTAVLELDTGRTSQEFGYYWVVRRKRRRKREEDDE